MTSLINTEGGGGFVVPDVQQTSYQGGSQQANQYVREAMRIKRQSCTATGGFNKGQGDNHGVSVWRRRSSAH